jgi:hypothetical protein
VKKKLLAGVLVAASGALTGVPATAVVAAKAAAQSWTVVVHFEYVDGFNYDYPLARGVSASELHSVLQECGRSHSAPSVVRYHCYPIPE